MRRVVERFPTLKVEAEHITTADAVQFVNAAPANVGATHHRTSLAVQPQPHAGGADSAALLPPADPQAHTHQEAPLTLPPRWLKFFLGTDRRTPGVPRKPHAAGAVATPLMRRPEMYAEVRTT